MNTFTVKVAAKNVEATDIVSFELTSVDDSPLPPFSAGAHIDVHTADGMVRQYSLCNDPTESHRYQIAVLRDAESRGGSIAMHDKVQPGDFLTISEPKNHFPLVPASRTLLLAGGIGITPILCMAERLNRIGGDFELHYCCRSEDRTAFRSRIAKAGFADKVHYHFDSGPAEQKLNIHSLVAHMDEEAHLYVCGPQGFIEHVVNAAKAASWPTSRIHFESFSAKRQDTSKDGSFEIMLASSGKSYLVAANRTVIEVLAEHDVEIPTACEQGVCGTCITRVIAGVPDHRDVYFSDDERAKNDQFTPCCSRAKTARLVLDL